MMMNDSIRREVMVEKTALDQEKAEVARELQIARDEVSGMAEKLQQKDLQLNSFGRTLQEVEELNRKKHELDSKIEKLESTAADTRLLIESQRTEVMSLRQENSKLQESFAKSQVNCHTLQDELRIIKESTAQQLNEVRNASAYQKDQNETEKFVLREALSKCEANLRTSENTLRSITENNVTLQNERKALEYSLNEVKSQLATEITERKLAQQREDNLKANIEEGKQNKFTVEERILEIQSLVTKREGEITQQKDRIKRLIHQNQELEATAHVHDSTVRAKQDQIDTLQVEVSKLQQLLESQKQQLNSKLRKMILEQKTERGSQQQEMQNLSQQAMQLSVDLEQAREQIALKNKENLKLQEEILGLEEQKRDINSELRLSRDSLKSEEVMQSKLVTRFTEQEEEVKRLRTMWAKQAEESGDGDTKSMW
ncbi:golgin subfamily A member 6-like protein 24 [Patella vulgata]|uniref:golgin subfamily A member 6-like protein 24 n=1 Tax=Patella vulgata TaxID=6465 RepID=UPI0024A9FD2C|nr:golgin subfamily A member 6-like protein 24 [Patella vulgata]